VRFDECGPCSVGLLNSQCLLLRHWRVATSRIASDDINARICAQAPHKGYVRAVPFIVCLRRKRCSTLSAAMIANRPVK